jgi:phosphatidylserine/phosphatidylglycerophosphate/cardiolipin synthase-like enzyme
MTPHKRWHPTSGLAALTIAAVMLSGCGTVPDAAALLHTNPLYLVAPRFVGPQGPLTARQAERVIARLQEHQETPSDILQRHLAFEQALTNVPLAVGNRVILLENATDTYRAMLAAIGSATDNINIGMYTFSNGPIGRMFANALIE